MHEKQFMLQQNSLFSTVFKFTKPRTKFALYSVYEAGMYAFMVHCSRKCGEKTARKDYARKYLTLNSCLLFLQKFVSEGSVVRDCIDHCTEKGKWNDK